MDRLLNLIKPTSLFMGEKDFQQLYLINKYLLKKYKTKIYTCKTIRNKNQVALSTRNFLLSNKELKVASYIAINIKKFKKILIKNNNSIHNIDDLKNFLIKKINTKFNFKIEYLQIKSLKNLDIYRKNQKFKIFIAYYLNKVRLIDNF